MSDQQPVKEYIDIVFDGPPSHVTGRFVEVENAEGASIHFGEWVERDDGYWVLRIPDYDRDIAALQGDKTALMSTIETIDIEAKGRIALARQSVVAQDHKIGEQEATITALKRTIDAQLDRLKSCSVRSTTIHRSVTEE